MKDKIDFIISLINKNCKHGKFILKFTKLEDEMDLELFFQNNNNDGDDGRYYVIRKAVFDISKKFGDEYCEEALYTEFIRDVIMGILFAKPTSQFPNIQTIPMLIENGYVPIIKKHEI